MDKSRKSIYIPIEIKVRELNSQLLLAAKAAEEGFATYIGSKPMIYHIVKNKPTRGGIFLYKGGLNNKKDLINEIKSKVDAYCVLDQELGPVFSKELSDRRLDSINQVLIDRYFAYDKNVVDFARDNYSSLNRDSIILSGWPREELWTKKYHFLYEKEKSRILSKYGDFFLFSSNFGFTSAFRIKEERNKYTRLRDEEHIKRMEKSMLKSFEGYTSFVNFIKQFSSENNDFKIIIRPHPSEDHKAWRDDLAGLSNVKIIYKGEITPWILAAKGLIHTGCTSAIQSHVMNKKTAFIKLQSSINESYKKTIEVSDIIVSSEDLLHWIRSTKNDEDNKTTTIPISSNHATSVIVSEFQKLIENEDKIFLFKTLNRMKYRLNSIRYFFFKKFNFSQSGFAQKIGVIKKGEVKSFLRLINPDLKVKKLANNCFIIFKQ